MHNLLHGMMSCRFRRGESRGRGCCGGRRDDDGAQAEGQGLHAQAGQGYWAQAAAIGERANQAKEEQESSTNSEGEAMRADLKERRDQVIDDIAKLRRERGACKLVGKPFPHQKRLERLQNELEAWGEADAEAHRREAAEQERIWQQQVAEWRDHAITALNNRDEGMVEYQHHIIEAFKALRRVAVNSENAGMWLHRISGEPVPVYLSRCEVEKMLTGLAAAEGASYSEWRTRVGNWEWKGHTTYDAACDWAKLLGKKTVRDVRRVIGNGEWQWRRRQKRRRLMS